MKIVRTIEWTRDDGKRVTRKVGKCERCSNEIVLAGFTNSCGCGADYNMSGDLLADRAQWGEETGESLSDILRIP